MPDDFASYSKSDLQEYAREVAAQNGIPQNYFMNLIAAESSWDPNAVSNKGAIGIAQIVPRWHPDVNAEDPYNSIAYLGTTLRSYFDEFGSWDRAVAAWNAGPTAVRKSGGIPDFPETTNYVKKIIGSDSGMLATLFPNKKPDDGSGSGGTILLTKLVIVGVGIALLAVAWGSYGR